MNQTDSQAAADTQRPVRRFRDRFKGNGSADNAQQAATLRSLSRTLDSVDHELQLLSHATKYNWVNQRLILLRNALIAVSVLIVVVVAAVACYREAYRQTLTIAAFDVPPKLAERGITGQVIAKALFDELIKRRELVTTLETGELKGAWAENRADVAIPEAKFTLQSVFRYLRYMTGNEISVDGEFILDGDDVTIKVRVAGKPPTVVRGKLAGWEVLVGDLANGVLQVTQPAVVVAYLGLKAETPQDLVALSQVLRRMSNQDPKLSGPVMSVAYDAYGSALRRQGKIDQALLAFNEAMALDSSNGVAVINAAGVLAAQRNYEAGAALFKRAQTMSLPESVKRRALWSRFAGAMNTGDCDAARAVMKEARQSPLYDPLRFVELEAGVLANCDYEEARAVALVEKFVQLHPDDERYANTLMLLQSRRPESRYLEQSIQAGRDAIAAGAGGGIVSLNLSHMLVEAGRIEEARALSKQAVRGDPIWLQISKSAFEALVHAQHKEFAKADEIFSSKSAERLMTETVWMVRHGRTKLAMNQYVEAIAILNDGLKRLPGSCWLWQELGDAHATSGDLPAALKTYENGIAAVPKCGLNYNAAARLLIKQNRISEAKQKLDALIRIAPNSDGAVIAKEILASLPK